MKTTTKIKTNFSRNKKKYNKDGIGLAIPAGILGLAGIVGYNIMKNNKKSKTTSSGGFQSVKELAEEKEANKQLVKHINLCNKEVIRLQGILRSKSSLHKEVLLRNTIKKMISKKNNWK